MRTPKESLNRRNSEKGLSGFDKSLKLLVIDDDPVFRAKFNAFAKKEGVAVKTCGTLEELAALKDRQTYSAVLIDYYLDERVVGAELAAIMGATPVVMMSSSPNEVLNENDVWPPSVRKFVSKAHGFRRLVGAAQRASKNKRR